MASASLTLKIVWTIALLLVIGGLGLLLAILVNRILRVRADRKHSLKLVNNGNIPSRYHLSFESVQPGLSFKCLDNRIPLVPVMEQVEVEPEVETPAPVSSQPVQAASAKQHDSKPAAVKPEGAIKAGKAVTAKSGVVAGLLGTLGGILPGKLGKDLKAKSDQARGVQLKTAQVTQAPQAASTKMDVLKSGSGRLGVKPTKGEQTSQDAETGTLAAASTANARVVMKVNEPAADGIRPFALKDTGLVQTRELGSGEALLLTLNIGKTTRRYPVGSFNYVIRSRQIPVDGRFGSPSPLTKTGTVYFKPISTFRYLLPMLGSSLVILLALLGIIYGLTYLWG